MSSILAVISLSLAVVFMVMWIRVRRAARQAEIVAYGLRAQDDRDDSTRTNLLKKNREYYVAIKKLNELGEIELDNWGRWVCTETGQQLGQG